MPQSQIPPPQKPRPALTYDQNLMLGEGFGPPVDLNAPRQGIRSVLEGLIGAKPNSPIDNYLHAPDRAIGGALDQARSSWNSLLEPVPSPTQAPKVPAAPASAPPQSDVAPPPPVVPGQFSLPGQIAGTQVTGRATFPGSKLGSSPALAGLKGLDSSANMSNPSSGGISEDEMYRHAFADPNSMAPGATQMWQTRLKDSIGDADFLKSLQQQQMQTVADAQTAQNPAVQAGLDQNANRGGLGIAKVQTQPALGYNEFLKSLPQNGGIHSITRSGVTYDNAVSHIPAQVKQAIAVGMGKLAQSGPTGMFGSGPSTQAVQAEALLNSAKSYVPNAEDIIAFAHSASVEPRFSKMTPDQILQSAGEDGLTPDEAYLFQTALTLQRGF